MEDRIMKKIYKTPSISTVSINSEDEFMKASKPGHQSADIFDGTEVTPGTGQGGDHGDAKGTGRFWDDEY